jgi:hypothetical protein
MLLAGLASLKVGEATTGQPSVGGGSSDDVELSRHLVDLLPIQQQMSGLPATQSGNCA